MATFERVLAPTDFSPCGDAALGWAIDRLGTDVGYVLLHVVDEGTAAAVADVTRQPLEEVIEEMWSRASRRLAERKNALESDGVRATALVRRGEPFTEIARVAGERDIEAIVIGAHGFSHEEGQERFGGTAERVVRSARVPVLCIPDPADR